MPLTTPEWPVESRRVLVTGGDGYLGSHLVARLVARGDDVLVVDDGRAGAVPDPGESRVTRLRADFREAGALATVRAFDPSVVFHLAAMHFVPDCERDPVACLRTNVLGTEALLATLRHTGVKVVVFTSSAVVYGFSDEACPEGHPMSPRHVYAYSKFLGEGLLAGFHRDNPHVRAVAARLFNLVGPGDTSPHVLPEIVRAITDGAPLRLGNLWPRRDYVHVDDVAAALVCLCSGEPGALAVNVGTGIGRSVIDLVQAVTGVVGREADVESDPARRRETDGHLVADIGLITRSTAWRPAWSLEATVRQLWEATH